MSRDTQSLEQRQKQMKERGLGRRRAPKVKGGRRIGMPGWLYVVRMENTPWFKIGVAVKDVDRRLSYVQQGLPQDIQVVGVAQAKDAYALERKLHREFEARRVRREWFALEEADIQRVHEILDAENGHPLKPHPSPRARDGLKPVTWLDDFLPDEDLVRLGYDPTKYYIPGTGIVPRDSVEYWRRRKAEEAQ